MRIVHSFWSKPGGSYHWPSVKHFLYSQVLSVMTAKKSYGNIHLITDTFGKNLIEYLKLPYNSIEVLLDNVPVKTNWWIWGKIIAYKQQREPFFHIDGDVYLWQKLPPEVDQASIVCQSFENQTNTCFGEVYTENRFDLENKLKNLPSFWPHMKDNAAINAGIFGGTAVDFIQHYATEVEKLLIQNVDASGWANVCLEQQTAYCAAKEAGLIFTALVNHLPRQQKIYTHVLGCKNDYFLLKRLENRIKKEYPLQFELITKKYAQSKNIFSPSSGNYIEEPLDLDWGQPAEFNDQLLITDQLTIDSCANIPINLIDLSSNCHNKFLTFKIEPNTDVSVTFTNSKGKSISIQANDYLSNQTATIPIHHFIAGDTQFDFKYTESVEVSGKGTIFDMMISESA